VSTPGIWIHPYFGGQCPVGPCPLGGRWRKLRRQLMRRSCCEHLFDDLAQTPRPKVGKLADKNRQATLAELASAASVSIGEVRLGLRRLAEQLVQEAVAQLVQPERLPRLSQEMAEVLAIVIMEAMATRRRIEEVRGAASLSIGPEGPVSLPGDSSATLALLVSRGLVSAEKDEHATGRPLVYRATPGLLQLLGAETLEEVRGRLDAVRH
jgi:chromosome segregation and condensation protein ScpB